MLPLRTLDDETFEEIAEKARRGIAKYYPAWTDYNLHDPGVTFIELFAWLKEIQQYHLDQISERSRRKFLKLLGVTPRTKKPALTFVRIYGLKEDLILPPGTRLLADHVEFETMSREYLTRGRITGGYSLTRGGERADFDALLTEEGRMRFPMFGQAPESGDAFYVRLDTALPPGEAHGLHMEFFDDYEIRRNAPDEGFIPLAGVEWEYYRADGWHKMDIIEDGTRAFILDGRLRFRLAEEMATLPEEGGYGIRAVLRAYDFEVPPVLAGLHLTMIPAAQKNTLSQYRDFQQSEGTSNLRGERVFTWDTELAIRGKCEVYLGRTGGDGLIRWERTEAFRKEAGRLEARFHLQSSLVEEGTAVRLVCYEESFSLRRRPGEGDGFPGQSFDLDTPDLLQEDFRIMVMEGAGYLQWEQEEDFDRSGPESRHFTLDELTGLLAFGDCEQGLAPEGEILIIGCAHSLGREGNVKEGRIGAFARAAVPALAVNPGVAAGGEGAESIDEAFLRLRRDLRKPDRAVTYGDYEDLVRAAPGLMVRNCKAIAASKNPRRDGSIDDNAVSVVVQPFGAGANRKLSAAYEDNLYRWLEDRRLLGAKVNILSPEYVGVKVYAEILVKPYYPDAEARIRRAVEEFFGGASWAFGETVQYSAIYGVVDTLDCVLGIQALTVDAQGKGIRRGVNGDVLLPQNGMAWLMEAEYLITAGE